MRIFLSSDPHLHGNEPGGDGAVIRLAHHVASQGTRDDVLMLLGDYGNSLESIRICLSLFASFKGKKLAVIGNHDLWDQYGTPDTVSRYQLLQSVIESAGFHALDRAPLIIGGLAFVGNIGWYDYSFQDLADVPPEAYESKTIPGKQDICWQDARYVNWQCSDREVVDQMIERLSRQLAQLNGERVIVGMHHVPIKRLLFHPRWIVPYEWRFANCFLGSDRFAKLFQQYRAKIGHVFCGHKHGFKTITEDGVRYTSLGGDYEHKELAVYYPDQNILEKAFRS
ncbi:MAG: hypothetical protein GWN94_25055 [Phycisphaerae bacterium]|nr:hypothetical protein [Phycisphaerae bacterium]